MDEHFEESTVMVLVSRFKEVYHHACTDHSVDIKLQVPEDGSRLKDIADVGLEWLCVDGLQVRAGEGSQRCEPDMWYADGAHTDPCIQIAAVSFLKRE